MAQVELDDRVLPLTRAVSAAIVPFLVLAFVVLCGWPDDTDRLFAWTIKPTLTPMVLGGVYLGGAYFFVLAARASEWHTIKAGFVSVTTFATMMGVATVLHWAKFNHHHVAFWLWVGLYFTTPFIIFGVWLANRRHERPATPDELRIPEWLGRLIGIVGVLACATSLFVFIRPARAIAIWPWMLTPLTARVMAAIFGLGISAVGAFTERRWSSIRVMLQVEAAMLILILVAVVRASDDIDTSRPLTWAFGGGFLVVLLATVALYVRMSRMTGTTQMSRGSLRSG